MTTKLDKAVYRECAQLTDLGREVIVGLESGDMLSFRVKGLRARPYRIRLEGIYHQIARAAAKGK